MSPFRTKIPQSNHGVSDGAAISQSIINATISTTLTWAQIATVRIPLNIVKFYLSNLCPMVRAANGTGVRAIQDATGAWWELDTTVNPVQMEWLGAVGDDVADDTAAILLAAQVYAAGRAIYAPGKYKYTQTFVLEQNSNPDGQSLNGIDKAQSYFNYTGAGNAIYITGAYFNGDLHDFNIYSTGKGIVSNAATLVQNCTWWNIDITSVGHCVEIPQHFYQEFDSMLVTSTTGHGFAIAGGNTILLTRCYASDCVGPYMAGFRIWAAGTLQACNGINSGDYWAVFGGQPPVTGTATAGAAGSITLATGSFDGEYVGFNIRITAGTGAGQTRMCSAFNSTTGVAAVTSNWSVVPDNTSVYSVEDTVSWMQVANYPEITMIGCNIEQPYIDGIRTINLNNISIIDCLFQARHTGTYNSFIHLYGGQPLNKGCIIIRPKFTYFSSTRTGGADIIVDVDTGSNPCIIGLGFLYDNDTGPSNKYYSTTDAVIRYFNTFDFKDLRLPVLPVADPADGTGTIWCDAGAANVLKRGT